MTATRSAVESALLAFFPLLFASPEDFPQADISTTTAIKIKIFVLIMMQKYKNVL
jgi:hypothetical protein